MLSRWRMQERHSGTVALGQIQHVFLELPKYRAGDAPSALVDRWAFFFRAAESLELVPSSLAEAPFRDALDVARLASFTAGELEAYDKAKVAEQDARGALTLAESRGLQRGRAEGHSAGLAEGLRGTVRALCTAFGVDVDARRAAALDALGLAELEELAERLLRDRRWPG